MGTTVGPWSLGVLRGLAAVLADTETGLTGREIGSLLARLNMEDPLPGATKRDRLAEALIRRQSHDGSAARIVTFIVHAMEPVSYRDRPELFDLRRDSLNERLAFVGLRVTNKGQVARGAIAETLDEATKIATSLRDELRRRRVHPRVLEYTSLEVLKKNNFHACLEACKSVFDQLRDLTGLTGDGAKLVDACLSLGKSGVPMLAINELNSVTERDEQTGLANLVKGLNGLFRNPVAHDPRLKREISNDELLDIMTTVSMVHRRLDDARRMSS
ncbi:TIGR02391 family protein [Rhodococcus sp. NPDC059968]|uniref:TIGR02391 family protein n=1 Tax=Rhodococcus sp. NPDC059968 TaxID=3347017 RepID=UPI00366B1E96